MSGRWNVLPPYEVGRVQELWSARPTRPRRPGAPAPDQGTSSPPEPLALETLFPLPDVVSQSGPGQTRRRPAKGEERRPGCGGSSGQQMTLDL